MHTKENNRLFIFENIPGCFQNNISGFEQKVRQEMSIRPGLWLSKINFSPQQEIQMRYKRKYPVVDFGFVISGDITKNIDNNPPSSKELHVKSGISGVQYARDQEGRFIINPEKKQQILHIHASLPFLKELLKNEYSILPSYLKSLLKDGIQNNFSNSNPMSPDIQAVVYQILNSSSNAIPWHLYLEGKILELLSLNLAALSINHTKPDGILLNPEEKQKITMVKEILVKDLYSPPTLQHLSSTAGLSVNKLQAGFREIYGKSVFNYLREHKMQTARFLLEKSQTNVSETAWRVGYTNVSHFGSAFKKRFGILPKQYLKESLKNQKSCPGSIEK